ncbi:DNA-3-methyladenine glycosylase family protein [Amycolatopsis panacis]|uniref:DNA-3-methyladenine glycosylase 2 family protein n=1 Tax=Amycolatopsis panacis TaxID=2340917 RepID=A0A419HZ78_9PSEU|nr:DNA-3-methyladenine glycosylase [Amycolatopsis panacis]RJQ82479.1 DNA-3-methyladenine glycosylase 2 family protein [Amycolatopsis panacis]
MERYETTVDVAGPWSLRTGKRFWEEFAPAAIAADDEPDALHARFLGERDWTAVSARIVQQGATAGIEVSGGGDLVAAAEQVARFLSLDVDATAWPEVGERDPVIASAQRSLPGYRPCGFHSPYEAAAWCVLSQRSRIPEAARLRRQLIAEFGHEGAFPAPGDLIRAIENESISLPGRKTEYLAAVAVAAFEGLLDGAYLRALPEEQARRELLSVKGIGPFAADLVLIRGANTQDILPLAERRLHAEIAYLYGPDVTLADASEAWRPFRSWAAVHLRALGEHRTGEMSRRDP